ncbi:MAG: GNAT family N-acetyltransferase [Planctomycetota bacterium]|nr:GNAT family N-acetyltransferase [Planctomycetota bacterium]MDA1179132.1 GNAT family N-acetyltransferase [Planctomycetota bacterium]
MAPATDTNTSVSPTLDVPTDVPPTYWMVAVERETVRGFTAASIRPGRLARVWPAWGAANFLSGDRQQLYDRLHAVIRPLAHVACLTWPQGLVECPDDDFRRSGYSRITHIDYLAGPVEHNQSDSHSESLVFRTLEPNDDRLVRVYSATLIDSHDCRNWHDPRSIQEILLGMGPSSGQSTYAIATTAQGVDVGCVVMSRHGLQDQVTVEYLGLIPSARGAGIGNELIAYARHTAQAWNCRTLGVYVDVENEPAQRLYGRNQFCPGSQFAFYARML